MSLNPRTNIYLQLLSELEASEQENRTLNSHVLLIDGLNTFFRAYSASPVTNSDGEHVGGISGFLLSIGSVIKLVRPTRVIIVFDGEGGSVRKRSLYADYKQGRKPIKYFNRNKSVQYSAQEEQSRQTYQLIRMIDFVEHLPVTMINVHSTEADDAIGYLVSDVLTEKVTIMSGDKDFYQLVNDRVSIWSPTKKIMLTEETVKEKMDVYPCNVNLFRSIIGDDASDNIKGVPGIGAKTLLKHIPLLKEPTNITIDEVITFCQENSSRISELILNNMDIIKRNMTICDLGDVALSGELKRQVYDQYNQSPSRLNKFEFLKLLTQERMESSIKNVHVWLHEVFNPLTIFTND